MDKEKKEVKDQSLFSEVIDELINYLTLPFQKKKPKKNVAKKKKSQPIKTASEEDLKALNEAISKGRQAFEFGEEEANIIKTWLNED